MASCAGVRATLAFARRGPNEAPFLQPLDEQAGALTVPPDDLHQVASSAAEDKEMAGKGVLLQLRLRLGSQRREAAPHVGYPGRQPDSGVGGDWDHEESLRMSRARASGS